jgi:N-acetylglutamate synthase-like GNAT family acetyltransferase
MPSYQIRRATVDDLPQLRQLWSEYRFPVPDLEKRFTEFKVAASEAEGLLGGLGMQVCGHHANLHSEAFTRPELEDEMRQLIWERLQVVAVNRGIVRFWTQETAPFWIHFAGFKELGEGERSVLPPSWGEPHTRWLTLALHEDNEPTAVIAQHLDWFKAQQQESMERVRFRAKVVRGAATFVAFMVFVALVLAGLYIARRQPLLLGR